MRYFVDGREFVSLYRVFAQSEPSTSGTDRPEPGPHRSSLSDRGRPCRRLPPNAAVAAPLVTAKAKPRFLAASAERNGIMAGDDEGDRYQAGQTDEASSRGLGARQKAFGQRHRVGRLRHDRDMVGEAYPGKAWPDALAFGESCLYGQCVAVRHRRANCVSR